MTRLFPDRPSPFSLIKPLKPSHFSVILCAFLFGILFVINPGYTQENEQTSDSERIEEILLILSGQAHLVQKELESLQKLPPSPSTNQRKNDLLEQLDGLNHNFNSIATQIELDESLNGDKKSDWAKELEALALPILEALSDLTKKPRRIEQLRKRIETLETQFAQFQKANSNVSGLLERHSGKTPPKTDQGRLYLEHLQRLKSRFNPELVELKLEEARKALDKELENTESVWETLSKATQSFFKHRGLNLLITIGIFAGLWFLLSKLRIFILGPRSIFNVPTWMKKVLATAYSILVMVICIISSLVALYLMNDWLLLSIIILFLAAVVWASRQFIPKLFKEVRLALNLGTVRENERLIWRGVPWQVKSIGLQATLENEQLDGGILYLPVGELIGQYSRPITPEEPWFPTRQGDWVVLGDGTYGQVDLQTVEQVVLKLKGNTRKYIATPDFMSQIPMNISHGFRYDLSFGLDYSLQTRICEEIPKLFHEGLREQLKIHFAGEEPDFPFMDISFDQAGASSLNLRIHVHVHGRCADQYEDILREIQAALVHICNEHQFTIPFNQLTLNLPDAWPSPPGIARPDGGKV